MSNYRRARVPGATYFFTENLRDRRSDLLVREVDLLRATVRATRVRHPFHIDAWVVLPEHMHCIWTLPTGDRDFAGRWKIIKRGSLYLAWWKIAARVFHPTPDDAPGGGKRRARWPRRGTQAAGGVG